MAIAGDRPETGVRIQIERDKTREDSPWNYRGAAHLPDATFPLAVVVTEAGDVEVSLSPSESGGIPPSDLSEKVRLIVRTVYRQSKSDDEPPAWKIVRWRGEK